MFRLYFLFLFLTTIQGFSQDHILEPNYIPEYGKTVRNFEYISVKGKPKKIIKYEFLRDIKRVYSFDKKNNLIEINVYSKDSLMYSILRSFNAQGNIISYKEILANDKIEDSVSYKYDSLNRIIEEKRLKFNSKKKYQYDKENKTMKVTDFHEGDSGAVNIFTYSEDRLMVHERKSDNSSYKKEYEYDKKGLSMTQTISKDNRGPLNNHIIKTKYSKNRVSTEKTFLKEAGIYFNTQKNPKVQELLYSSSKNQKTIKFVENKIITGTYSIEYDDYGNYKKVIDNRISEINPIVTRVIEYY